MKSFVLPVIISIAAIACFWIAANAVTYKFRNTETITVTGLAEKDFSSDQITWSATYSRKSMDLKSAYAMWAFFKSPARTAEKNLVQEVSLTPARKTRLLLSQ